VLWGPDSVRLFNPFEALTAARVRDPEPAAQPRRSAAVRTLQPVQKGERWPTHGRSKNLKIRRVRHFEVVRAEVLARVAVEHEWLRLIRHQ